MERRFTLVRLLLAVILINTVLITLYVLEITGSAKVLSAVLPGTLGPTSTWGNYVFLSFLFLVNAVLVLGTGFAVVLPALLDRLSIAPARLKDILTNRAGVSPSACAAVVDAVRDEQEHERQQLRAGRWVFRIGAVFFVLAFPFWCFTYAHADADGTPLFVNTAIHQPVANSAVQLSDVVTYTTDQVLGAVLLDATEVYDIRFSLLNHNPANPWMPTAAFLFRSIVGLILIVGLLAVFRGMRLKSYTRRAEAAAEHADADEAAEAHAH